MNRKLILIIAAACCICSCAKTPTAGKNDSAKRYFDAWVHVQKQEHPEYEWKQTDWGSYVLQESEGKGAVLGEFDDSLYLRVEFTSYSLDGTINETTSETISKQIGSYEEGDYYGPKVWYASGTYAGVEELMKGMKPGGFKKAVIPGWLCTYSRYDTADEYVDNCSGTDIIYDIKYLEAIHDMTEWEIDSISRYLSRNYPGKYGSDPAQAKADSAGAHGFYYISMKAPSDTTTLKDTTVYINYIGRLLNGQVFDTNIRDTAMFYGIYSSSGSYEPVTIEYDEEWSDIRMGSSSSTVVDGFAHTLFKMKAHEKGIGIFHSGLGYDYSGSGNKIPGYSPLRFDIELVDAPE